MGGVALRFCLVFGRVLMVVYCCASGCFGCVWACSEGGSPLRKRLHWMQMHLDPSSPGRCLGGVDSALRASDSDVTLFSWVVWRCNFFF